MRNCGRNCWETARRSIRPIFFCAPCRKTMHWIKIWILPFLMGTTSSITVQSLGKIVQCVPAVAAKMWCLFFFCFYFLSRSESRAPCIRGVHISNNHSVARYRPILMRVSAFFRRDCSFRGTTWFSFLSPGVATIFTKLPSKITKSPKTYGNVCAHHCV